MRMKRSVAGCVVFFAVSPIVMASVSSTSGSDEVPLMLRKSTFLVSQLSANTTPEAITTPSTPAISESAPSQPMPSQPMPSQPGSSQSVTSESVPLQSVTSHSVSSESITAPKSTLTLPKSGVAVPGAFFTGPMIAMVSPLGVKMNSSPAGFGAAPNAKNCEMKSKSSKKCTMKTEKVVAQPASVNTTPVVKGIPVSKPVAKPVVKPVVNQAEMQPAQPAPAVHTSSFKLEGKPRANQVLESNLVSKPVPMEASVQYDKSQSPAWQYSSRYKDGSVKKATYCPLVSVALGYGRAGQLGTSKDFPAGISDGVNFYNYTDHTPTQSQTVYGFFGGYELAIDPRLSMQVGLAYYQSGAFDAKGLVSQGTSPATAVVFPYNYYVSSQRWLIESKLLYNKRRLHPYVMAGIGAAVNEAANFQVGSGATASYQFGNNTMRSITYSLGIGLDVDVAANVRLGIGYRFSDYGSYQLGRGVIGSTVTTNDLGQAHLYVNEILAQFILFL